MSAAAALRPAVAGYVEAVTAVAVLGWAWIPGDGTPLTVMLRLGEATLSEAVADGLRDDLARSGIGEGRHAFTLPVPEDHRARLGELRVYARTPDGDAVPLGAPPAEDGVGETLVRLQRGMEMLVGSQRVLHRNLQAALLARGDVNPDPNLSRPAADQARINPAADQARIRDEIATLELFVVRLEQALAASRPDAPPPAGGPRWALGAVAGAAGLALLLSGWALIHALPG
ncbi:MAG: hypothetical protein ACRYGM_23800 [Janthinobacterium lividum]